MTLKDYDIVLGQMMTRTLKEQHSREQRCAAYYPPLSLEEGLGAVLGHGPERWQALEGPVRSVRSLFKNKQIV